MRKLALEKDLTFGHLPCQLYVHQSECRTPQNLMAQNYKYWGRLLLSYFAMKSDYHVLRNARNHSVMSSPKNRKKITIYFYHAYVVGLPVKTDYY
jgi:hypothetical protein